MKTLYISDLDGTLFNSKKKISSYSTEVINRYIEDGMMFSVATARMPYGCDYRLEKLKLQTPGILTNGVFIYDFSKKKFLHAETIDKVTAKKVINAFHENKQDCFMYLFGDNKIRIYYGSKDLEAQIQYYSERALSECDVVAVTSDYAKNMEDGDVFYFARTGTKEELEPVKAAVDKIEGVSCVLYLNIYNQLYCLEVFSNKASKKHALLKLKEIMKADELVVFGDNYNDVPMIEVADRSYAPANALEEVKQMVNDVLDDCNNDGVAKFLEKEMQLKS
ncbi:HAD-IIB family hydrolase [Faecalicatena orotica]|uniref:HAD-IIB family hydrolase n=1 Tax=Faecalicatena orotica TaxID=1544 RepID=UPI00321642C0